MTGLPIVAPHELVAKKPKHGEPCNRCGLCCIGSLCPLGQKIFKRALGPCPALSFDAAGQSVCGMIANPAEFSLRAVAKQGTEAASEAAAHLVGAGLGCDCRINGERPDPKFYDRLRAHDRKTVSKTRAARKLWGL